VANLFTYEELKDLVPNIRNDAKWQSHIASADAIIKARLGNRVLVDAEDYKDIVCIPRGLSDISKIYLKEFPITEIVKIEIDGRDIEAELDTDYYYIYAINSQDIIGIELDLPLDSGQEIAITYKGGYTTIPEPIKTAFVIMVGICQQKIEQGIAKTESSGIISTTFQDSTESFAYIDQILKPYKFKQALA
jgi:hypothetical protein